MKKLFILLWAVFQGFAALSQPDAFIQNYMSTNHIPGCAAIVLKDGRIIYEKYFGKANLQTNQLVSANTIFMIASISKTITATALMKENENGAFNLNDDINVHLPFSVRNPSHNTIPITYKQLLTHTSSIQDNFGQVNLVVNGDSPISFNTFFGGYLVPSGIYYHPNNYYNYAPATTWNYCNVGAALCGYLTSQLSSRAFDGYCNDSIFTPLCMDNTSWFLSGLDTTKIARPYSYSGSNYTDNGLYGYPDYPDGQLRTTATSLAKFMQMHINYGKLGTTRILDSLTVKNMRTIQLPSIKATQGLIFYKIDTIGRTLWGHEGIDSGVHTNMFFDLADRTGVIVLTNSDADPFPITQQLFNYALGIPAGTGTLLTCSTTGVETIQASDDNVTIYPNPVSNFFHVSDVDYVFGAIYNSCGELISTASNQNNINIANLTSGLYFIEIKNAQSLNKIKVLKFIKE